MSDVAEIVLPEVVPASLLLAQPRSDWLQRWSRFAADMQTRNLPASVIKKARWVLLDSIGAIAGGMREPEVKALVARESSSGNAALIGGGRTASPLGAALINGIAGVTLELDEGNQFARGHPGMHVVPAILAAVQPEQSLDQLLRALILGYEIGSRIGIASKLRVTMHPHGTWGTVGAALGVATLAAADADAIANTINIAANLTLATSRRTMLEGATVRNAFTGLSNQLGLLAHTLNGAGFGGESDGVATVYDAIVAEDFAPEAMLDGLGDRWEIARNYFKMHAACRYTHAALDVLGDLMKQTTIAADMVDDIEVDTYCWAAQLDHARPETMLAAKFSIPFAVATTLVHGAATPDAFREKARSDAAIIALAARVRVREDKTMTRSLPAERPARLTVRLRDGRELSGVARTNRGDTEQPYALDDIVAKYHRLADPVWGNALAMQIRETVLTAEATQSVRTLIGLLGQPVKP